MTNCQMVKNKLHARQTHLNIGVDHETFNAHFKYIFIEFVYYVQNLIYIGQCAISKTV